MDKSIRGLQSVPFYQRSEEEQLKIILSGKPRPKLWIPSKSNDREIFDPSCYDKEIWLTACEKRNRFFCWACLLFGIEAESIWTVDGFRDYDQLDENINRHKTVPCHVNAVLNLQLYIRQNASKMFAAWDDPKSSNLVKSNRDLLKRVLDVLCFVATQASSPPVNSSLELDEYIKETCFGMLSLCQDDEAAEFVIANNGEFLVDIIKALSNMMQNKLKDEMQACKYVSLILNGHSDITSFGQRSLKISAVCRYLKGSRVVERFAGFMSRREKDLESVGACMSDVMRRYEIIQSKLIAFSCDGSVLPSTKLLTMPQLHLTSRCYFVPCHFHRIEVVLKQSLMRHPQVALCFDMLASIKECLRGGSSDPTNFLGINKAFVQFTGITSETLVVLDDWNFTRFVLRHRQLLIRFFKQMVQEPEAWSDTDVTRAMAFYKTLEEFDTIFTLEMIYAMGDSVSAMSERPLQELLEGTSVERAIVSLHRIGLKNFSQIWRQACCQATASGGESMIPKETEMPRFIQLFGEVMKTVTNEIRIRFDCRKKLYSVFQLISTGKKEREVTRNVEFCGQKFGRIKLNKDLKVADLLLSKHSVYKTYEILLAENKRSGANQYVCSLTEMVLTIPCLPPSPPPPPVVTYTPTKLDKINFWASFSSPIVNDWSIICIERDVLKNLTSDKQLFEEFICVFQTLNTTLQLT